jgi:hypothetical protein
MHGVLQKSLDDAGMSAIAWHASDGSPTIEVRVEMAADGKRGELDAARSLASNGRRR